MNDVMFLIQLIQRASGLLRQLRDRGSEVLTDEEKASLGIEDDESRDRLIAAIENAIAREQAED